MNTILCSKFLDNIFKASTLNLNTHKVPSTSPQRKKKIHYLSKEPLSLIQISLPFFSSSKEGMTFMPVTLTEAWPLCPLVTVKRAWP